MLLPATWWFACTFQAAVVPAAIACGTALEDAYTTWQHPLQSLYYAHCRHSVMFTQIATTRTWLLLPAVVVPSFLKTVLRPARLAAVVPGLMPSSAATVT
jgi:hypothetical protein